MKKVIEIDEDRLYEAVHKEITSQSKFCCLRLAGKDVIILTKGIVHEIKAAQVKSLREEAVCRSLNEVFELVKGFS
jgi:hypothetical protein